MIRVLLIFVIIVTFISLFKYGSSIRAKAWAKLLIMFFCFIAIFSLIFPSILDAAAKFVGVGRGADLILYMLVVSFLICVPFLYLYSSQENTKITKIVRKLAIIQAASELDGRFDQVKNKTK